jgi:hypothetical protein
MIFKTTTAPTTVETITSVANTAVGLLVGGATAYALIGIGNKAFAEANALDIEAQNRASQLGLVSRRPILTVEQKEAADAASWFNWGAAAAATTPAQSAMSKEDIADIVKKTMEAERKA